MSRANADIVMDYRAWGGYITPVSESGTRFLNILKRVRDSIEDVRHNHEDKIGVYCKRKMEEVRQMSIGAGLTLATECDCDCG